MEPEKFLTPAEFNALLRATKDDRDRCILLLLAGAGLRVGEMTQIKAEDIDLEKRYLYVEALNAKYNKPRTVVLLPQVAESCRSSLKDEKRNGCFQAIERGISHQGRSRIFLMALPQEPACKRLSAKIRQEKIGIVYIPIFSGIALLSGA